MSKRTPANSGHAPTTETTQSQSFVPPSARDGLDQRHSRETLAPYSSARARLRRLLLANHESPAWARPAINLADDAAVELEWADGNRYAGIVVTSSGNVGCEPGLTRPTGGPPVGDGPCSAGAGPTPAPWS